MEDECERSERIGKWERCFGYKRSGRVEKACCRQSRLRLMSIRRSRNKRIESLDSSLGDIRTRIQSHLIYSAINTPHLDSASTITTNNPTAKRRVNASKRGDRILVRPEQILLIVTQQHHPLRRAVLLATGLCRARPRLNVACCRTAGGRGRAISVIIRSFYEHSTGREVPVARLLVLQLCPA
jgi:hypothetical protein